MRARIAESNFEIAQGDDVDLVLGPFLIRDPVSGVDQPLDLTAGGIKVWLTAKLSLAEADTAAEIRKGSPATGIAGGGITLNVPATATKNWLTARISAADTDALDLGPANLLELRYDVQIEEPGPRKTTIQRGALLVRGDVTNA